MCRQQQQKTMFHWHREFICSRAYFINFAFSILLALLSLRFHSTEFSFYSISIAFIVDRLIFLLFHFSLDKRRSLEWHVHKAWNLGESIINSEAARPCLVEKYMLSTLYSEMCLKVTYQWCSDVQAKWERVNAWEMSIKCQMVLAKSRFEFNFDGRQWNPI